MTRRIERPTRRLERTRNRVAEKLARNDQPPHVLRSPPERPAVVLLESDRDPTPPPVSEGASVGLHLIVARG